MVLPSAEPSSSIKDTVQSHHHSAPNLHHGLQLLWRFAAALPISGHAGQCLCKRRHRPGGDAQRSECFGEARQYCVAVAAPLASSNRPRLTCLSQEPLDAGLFPGSYDAFSFHGLPTPQHGGSPDNALPTPHPLTTAGSVDSGLGGDLDEGGAGRGRSSSEEKEVNLTPAQSRRKAQNRAAYALSPRPPPNPVAKTSADPGRHSQRAFRERKERHVRDLEAKLNALENNTHSLQLDNDRLKLALQRARTENEILRATSGHSPTSSRRVSAAYPSPGALLPDEEDMYDEGYNVQPLSNGSVVNTADKEHPASRLDSTGGREVPAAQAWDVIQTHPLVKQGLVDVTDVVERLKGVAKCDGHGPVFKESVIWQAVEESRRSGGDELI